MQNKKTILVIGVLVLVVSAAAFVGGRMFNSDVSPLGLFGLAGDKDGVKASINLIPAQELPTTPPEVMGMFAERKDKTIFVQAFSLDVEGNVMVVAKGGGEAVPSVAGSPAETDSGPKVEIVITNETLIYRDTTEMDRPNPGETRTVQQTVEESKLDDLNSESMLTVWGRKSGDRIIAEALFYSNPVMFNRP